MRAHQPIELPSHEVLSELARENPQAYEDLRREMIDRFIESAPERLKPRLSGIQFRVDCVRGSSRSALGATVRVYQMMWETFLHLNQNWQDAVRLKAACIQPDASRRISGHTPLQSAKILTFPPRYVRDTG